MTRAQPNDSDDADLARTLRSSATFLARWKGAHVEVSPRPWPPGSLQLLLTRAGGGGNLLLICGDHQWVRGPTRWDDAGLIVRRDPLPAALRDANCGRAGFRIVDHGAGAEVVTTHLSVFENVVRPNPGPPVRPSPPVPGGMA
jgi:hypothetical protein